MDAKKLYPNLNEDGYFRTPYDYSPIIKAAGEVLVEVSDRDYQGDTRVLLRGEDGRIGIMWFGWGSCSGCDRLTGCDSYDELQRLVDDMLERVKWFSNEEEALNYFFNHDWEGDYSYNQEETKDFLKQCIGHLKGFLPEQLLIDDMQPGETLHICNEEELPDNKFLRECEEDLGIEPKLNLYVWEGVLGDYTDGIVVAYARSKRDALQLVRIKSEVAWRQVKDIEPRLVQELAAFVIFGGS